MKTKQIYYQETYLKELVCRVLSSEENGSLVNLILDQTIFYPEGGGQPSDRGVIESKSWSAKVEYVRLINDEIIHQVKPNGEIKVGDETKAKIDWEWRYKYMKIHSAGHLLHDVLMTITQNLSPLRGSHGKKAFLEYEGKIDVAIKDKLEKEVNEKALSGLPIVTQEATYEELVRECQFVPSNLPKSKNLRMIRIGDYHPMPDGGIHVRNTKEIGKIWIANLTSEGNRTVVRYGVYQLN